MSTHKKTVIGEVKQKNDFTKRYVRPCHTHRSKNEPNYQCSLRQARALQLWTQTHLPVPDVINEAVTSTHTLTDIDASAIDIYLDQTQGTTEIPILPSIRNLEETLMQVTSETRGRTNDQKMETNAKIANILESVVTILKRITENN